MAAAAGPAMPGPVTTLRVLRQGIEVHLATERTELLIERGEPHIPAHTLDLDACAFDSQAE
jgi:hypothetical protein